MPEQYYDASSTYCAATSFRCSNFHQYNGLGLDLGDVKHEPACKNQRKEKLNHNNFFSVELSCMKISNYIWNGYMRCLVCVCVFVRFWRQLPDVRAEFRWKQMLLIIIWLEQTFRAQCNRFFFVCLLSVGLMFFIPGRALCIFRT